jgi:hypothetical protein
MARAYFLPSELTLKLGKNSWQRMAFGKEAEKFTAKNHLQQRSVHVSPASFLAAEDTAR